MSDINLFSQEEIEAILVANREHLRKLREDEGRALTANFRGAREQVLTDFSEGDLFGGPKQEEMF